jgi:hypothetical protein
MRDMVSLVFINGNRSLHGYGHDKNVFARNLDGNQRPAFFVSPSVALEKYKAHAAYRLFNVVANELFFRSFD